MGVFAPTITPWKRVARVIPTAARSVTSTTYVAVPTDTVTLTNLVKKQAGTNLVIRISSLCYMATNGAATLGVNFNATNYDVCAIFFNTANVYGNHSGELEISGIAAGTYTFTLQVKVGSGLSWNIDNNGQMNLSVEEVYPS